MEADYEAKEAQEGTAKMKWDSKLRLRQSKLVAAGKPMDRAAVLALYLDEAIVGAENKVRLGRWRAQKKRGLRKERGINCCASTRVLVSPFPLALVWF